MYYIFSDFSTPKDMVVSRSKNTRLNHNKNKIGEGLLNKIINKLPFELHLPGYQFCGPGTKIAERLARGDRGINPLDAACREHDIAYSRNQENISARNKSDLVLAEKAWKRVFASDAHIGEKTAALLITNAMKGKSKLGMGFRGKKKKRKNTRKKKCGKGLKRKPRVRRTIKKKTSKRKKVRLSTIIRTAKNSMKLNQGSNVAVQSALQAARGAVKQFGGKSHILMPRTLPIPPKIGGFLPFLVPIFSALSAAGALAGGTASIVKAVNNASAAKKQLHESKRHNKTLEAIALGKGLHLRPYRKGMGIYFNPKNFQ